MYTVAEIAEKLKVDPNTIYKWKAAGKIPYTKLPSGSVRFDEQKIDNWINNRSIEPRARKTA